MTTAPATIRLTSTDLVCTPGIVRWALNVFKDAGQRGFIVNLVSTTYHLNPEVVRLILSGEIEIVIDDEQETVSFTTDLPYRA